MTNALVENVNGAHDAVGLTAWERLQAESILMQVDPLSPVKAAAQLRRPTTVMNWVWIVLIVAIAVVASIGIMAYVATVCIKRGGSYNGGLSIGTNGWKVWEYTLKFKCSR
ncbi:hypothetical protein [Nocardioides sp. 616]|uniref:hypothetical protein n=1 Tax=Nocardioides sp. 616 TaxID=2268090 RepID=UPI0013B46534|nr:hypothetical protein [Nocardioides sp. 616]